MSRRSLRTPALLVRHARSNIGASILVAVLVLLVTFVVAVAPRALVQLSTAELRHELDSLSVPVRDVTGGNASLFTGSGDVDLPNDVADIYGLTEERLYDIRDDSPTLLRSVLGEPDYVGRSQGVLSTSDTTKSGEPGFMTIAADPRIEDRIRMVDGSFPATPDDPEDPLQITLSVDSAREMMWEAGETREDPNGQRVTLTGTFEAVNPDADYWTHVTSVLIPAIDDDGNRPRSITGTGYVAPLALGEGVLSFEPFTLTAWYPVSADRIDFPTATDLEPELRRFLAAVHQLPSFSTSPEQPYTLSSGTLEAIDTALARTAVTSAVLGMAASGPLGVVLAVFALATRSVVDRRRPALALAAARGGSPLQLRGAMALEGLVLGLIPGAVAIVVATLVVAVPVGLDAALPAILIALAPAVLFAAAGEPGGLRTTRADLGSRGRGRIRGIAEILVVLLAGVALFLLVQRGLVTSVGTTGVDPLLAATPLLLSLAVCVGVLRLYPLPLHALHRRLRKGTGLVGSVGSARAVRDPAVGLAAALAIVVAVSVAVFSATLLSTIDFALQSSARTSVGGGDLRAESRFFTDDAQSAIAAIEGVATVAGIDDQGSGALRLGSSGSNTELLTAQTSELSGIRSDVPSSMDERIDGGIPIVISADLVTQFGDDANGTLSLQGEPVVVVGVLPEDAGLGPRSNWVMVDNAFTSDMGDFTFAPQTLLMTTVPDASAATIAESITSAVLAARVLTFDDALAATQDSPTVAGLRVAFLLAIGAVSLLAALAVVLSSVIGSESRNRVLGALRTLGLSRRQARGIVAWELAPVVITALIAGTLLGLALPFVVTSTVDLSAFTGGTAVAGPHIDPLFLGIVLGIVVLATLAASAVSVVLSLRRTPASTVKIGAD
jgi:putative ABC transport system permease protein